MSSIHCWSSCQTHRQRSLGSRRRNILITISRGRWPTISNCLTTLLPKGERGGCLLDTAMYRGEVNACEERRRDLAGDGLYGVKNVSSGLCCSVDSCADISSVDPSGESSRDGRQGESAEKLVNMAYTLSPLWWLRYYLTWDKAEFPPLYPPN